MIRRILGEAMFIQKNSGLLKNDTARNMTQNKLRSRWYLALVNLLIVGGAIVVPGEMVLGQNVARGKSGCNHIPQACNHHCHHNPEYCNDPPQPVVRPGVPIYPVEQIMQQINQLYPEALQQLKKDDPQAIQKLSQGDTETLQKLQKLAPASKKQIQELRLNSRRERRNRARYTDK